MITIKTIGTIVIGKITRLELVISFITVYPLEKFKIKYGVKLSIRDFSTKLVEFIDIRKSAFSSIASAHIEINKKREGENNDSSTNK